MTDQEFLHAFESGRIPPAEFHHRDHLRLAWVQVRKLGAEQAAGAVAEGIGRFAGAHGQHRLYHETLTRHGFGAAVDAARQEWQAQRRDAAMNAIPDEMVDAIAACGPASRVRARLDELRAAGADLPIAFLPMESSPAQVRRTIAAIA